MVEQSSSNYDGHEVNVLDGLVLWTSTQRPFTILYNIALSLEVNRVDILNILTTILRSL